MCNCFACESSLPFFPFFLYLQYPVAACIFFFFFVSVRILHPFLCCFLLLFFVSVYCMCIFMHEIYIFGE
ncbi:hypothetical protein, unlikely [Trypanosoma brucei gambiense DAL972]|uniref:Uncharacterized protein n=1 Tax=Trypanosoma brucei gambiense (strain MHOM/CI/86/DAL972) TaxID=679716 RepID=C9ZIR0_TRYB9|nr:hypothetical protein, unlikely [Trypanosoma brucei gambiense DAL972]CBH09052.1 hypothetical protein, unlikely [Trypanosoma brucei gambiense DAL972]|eukprot:XP_011771493.1 hypothetical protein, unlikely [Trypanosoma brucei gambiense DAL972]